MRFSRVATLAGLLCLVAFLIAGCGDDDSRSSGKVEDRPAPPASDFPSASGKSLADVLNSASAPSTLVLTPTQRVFYKGTNRFGFGVFTRSKRVQVPDAKIALYVAKAPPAGALGSAKANGAVAKGGGKGRLEQALGGSASGPYPARIESLETEPAFRAQTTANDPDSGKAVYVSDVNLPKNGEWRVGALIKENGKTTATILPSAVAGQFKTIPRVGERPPRIHTPTPESVGGDLSKLTTRVPPERMNQVDFADALGKKPIVLVFATPQFCESRVCGPVIDIQSQVQRDYGDKADFVHMEIYNDNDPNKGVRSQVRAFGLPSEPWLFVIDGRGVIRTEIEGAFNLRELTDAVKGVTGG